MDTQEPPIIEDDDSHKRFEDAMKKILSISPGKVKEIIRKTKKKSVLKSEDNSKQS